MHFSSINRQYSKIHSPTTKKKHNKPPHKILTLLKLRAVRFYNLTLFCIYIPAKGKIEVKGCFQLEKMRKFILHSQNDVI